MEHRIFPWSSLDAGVCKHEKKFPKPADKQNLALEWIEFKGPLDSLRV
jgi:hypothetical protein